MKGHDLMEQREHVVDARIKRSFACEQARQCHKKGRGRLGCGSRNEHNNRNM
jgi:hypothetical protein